MESKQGTCEKNAGSSEISENLILDNEISEYESDYCEICDDRYYDHDYEIDLRAELAGLPRRGHDLKHGKVIVNRGSNQEKFISARPKALVKYGKCDVPGSANDIDEQSQSIVDDAINKYRYFASVNGVIRSGERSILLHCSGHLIPSDNNKPREYLLKVYRLQFGLPRTEKWAMNEYVNGWHMFPHANIPNTYCPTRNVIAMNFIGDYGKPAPNLNEVKTEITEKMYNDVISSMYKLYHNAKRVHGRLSARTILLWQDKLYFISLSSGVETSHPKALELLMKDCCHVTHFFKSKGLLRVKSIMNLFKHITGMVQPDASTLRALKYNRKQVKHKQKKKKQPHESI